MSGACSSRSRIAHWLAIHSAGRATRTLPVPRTAMAFRFFEPITAPTPDRPAARNLSFTMAAKSTWFSPAGPMAATEQSGTPVSARIRSSVSKIPEPHRCSAGRSSIWSSRIQRYTGRSERPWKTMAS